MRGDPAGSGQLRVDKEPTGPAQRLATRLQRDIGSGAQPRIDEGFLDFA
jgi:hypothetical protein